MEIGGITGTLDLSENKVREKIKESDIDAGDFIKIYEMGFGKNHGGFLGGTGLEGRMFEFENLFWVAWSDDEYIDVAVFPKD